MKHILFSTAIALMLCTTAAQSQDNLSTTRLESQHKSTAPMEKRLAQYEENLVNTLRNENATMQAQAVQTMRELEQMFPKHPFKAFLAPLAEKLRDEKADGVTRLLAALALDELHSDAGDAVIKDVSTSSQDKGLRTLCNALLVRSQMK